MASIKMAVVCLLLLCFVQSMVSGRYADVKHHVEKRQVGAGKLRYCFI